nr:hypothetical protein [uncultured bacterium]
MLRFATLFLALLLPGAVLAQTWTPQTTPTAEPLADVEFLDPMNGFAVADGGLLLRTTNGGTTWTSEILFGGALDLEGLAFNPSGTVGVIATGDGPVFRSTDGGATWALVNTGAQDLRHVDWAGDTAVWVAGRDGDSALSTDAGQTWTFRPTGSIDRTESISAVSATEAWIANRSGEIRHTTNGGASWTSQPSGTTSDLKDIQMLDASTGYIAGNGNVVLKTTNGGATWTNVATSGVSGNGLFFLDATTGWVVADAGQIWFTDNGGASWATQPSGVAASFNRVHFPVDTQGWAVGDAGTVVHFTTGTTGAGPDETPARFALEPAYPNPFNPSTQLRFSLDADGPARLAVYDALGREVTVLVQGTLPSGDHAIAFNAEGLPSGLYLARLTAGTRSQVRTLTLAR